MDTQAEELGFAEAEKRLSTALRRLVEEHGYLLNVDANERSVTHHLANQLAKQYAGWDVDVEYNRDGMDVKHMGLSIPAASADDTNSVTVFPDIIVHRRGTAQNLLVVEVKKPGQPRSFDELKLAAFTRPNPAGLGYQWGVHIVLPPSPSTPAETRWLHHGAVK